MLIHGFAFTYAEGLDVDIQQLNEILRTPSSHLVSNAEDDAFNRLVLTANAVARRRLLRAYARYLKQIRLGFDLGYIASALNAHTDITRELVRLFKTRFYLAHTEAHHWEDLEDKQQKLEQAILGALEVRCSAGTASR